jgi:hypothetical protein
MKFTLTFVLLMLPFAAQAQAPAKPEAAKPEAAKPEPAKPEAMKADKEEDVQMSEEAIAKAKAEDETLLRKKAAEDAAAERQRQREARLALCVIKPVMSDPEIELCKVAYRDDK